MHVLVIFKNFADNFAFVHDMVVKHRHGIWSAINYRPGMVLYNVGYAVARKTANSVLVDDPSASIIVLVVIVYWGQERFKVTDEIK